MKDLFTIVVTHYNQGDYIFEALDSVIAQDYSNIELIVTDDCSVNFEKEKIEKYINDNKNNNIKNVEFIINKQNIGTVKTLNKAIKKAKGKYISFFAADDALYDEKVITKYVTAFNVNDCRIVTAQSYEYDENLIKCKYPYVNVKKAIKYNKYTPIKLYSKMAKQCIYASGATAYEISIFKDYGYFNENYILVEDWSYFLFILRQGVHIYYENISALKHRNGGISHNNKITPTVKIYYNDLIKVYENEIIKALPNNISDVDKLSIYKSSLKDLTKYLDLLKVTDKTYYLNLINDSIKQNIKNYKIAQIKFKLYNFIKWHIYYKFKNISKSNSLLYFTFIIWILLNIFILKGVYINVSTNYLFFYLISSFIATSIVTKILIDMGDNAVICFPVTGFITYFLFKIFKIKNMFYGIILLVILYIFIYYFLHLSKLFINRKK